MEELKAFRHNWYSCTGNHQKDWRKSVSFCVQADDVAVKINKGAYMVRSRLQILVKLCVSKLSRSKG